MLGLVLAAGVTLPIQCAVPHDDGAPVVDAAWLAERVAQANTIFAPHDIQFVLRPTRALPDSHATLEDRRDRTRLVGLLRRGVINCFVVRSLRDIHQTWRLRQGVHWRPRGRHGGKHYVIIAAYSGPTVLAHELGHFFGVRKHSATPGNIMSYGRGPETPVFDAAQVRIIRRFLRRFLRSGELKEAVEVNDARPGAPGDRPRAGPAGP